MQLLTEGLGLGSSILGSVLSGKPKTQTSTTTPTLTPQMQAMMDQLSSYSNNAMSNGGGQAVTTMKNTALDANNRNYSKVASRMASTFGARGYGSSGSFGNTEFNTEMSRAGDASNLEGVFAKMGLDQQNFGATLGQNLLNFGKGSTTTGTTPDTSAQNGFMSAGNGLSNISSMLMLSKLLKGGGGGGGGNQLPNGQSYNMNPDPGYGGGDSGGDGGDN